jgi:multicomponent Na+:H+ antiporter subunit F
MMGVVGIIATALLAAGALLAVVRMERGPSMLDRSVAFDVLTSALVGAIAVEAALSRRTESVPILVVLSMVGFIGSVTIARFAAVEPPKEDGRHDIRPEPPGDPADSDGDGDRQETR